MPAETGLNEIGLDKLLEKVKDVVLEYLPYISKTSREPTVLLCRMIPHRPITESNKATSIGPKLFCWSWTNLPEAYSPR